jgi:outer membrane immunogenic protein
VKKLAIGIATLAVLIGKPVLAADMPVKASSVPSPVYSWTGCYLGGNVGGAWQRNYTVDVTVVPTFDTGGDNASSVVGGVQVGCDYQLASSLVIGVQGMFDWTGIKASHPPAPLATEILGLNTKSVGTLTGRIGYIVWPQILLYFKGGAAWAGIDYSDVDPAGNNPYAGQASVTRSGWTVGAGAEYALLPNWSVFAEYDYIDLGSRNVSLTYNCGTANQCGFANPYTYRVSHNISEFLVGINYRFGWGR